MTLRTKFILAFVAIILILGAAVVVFVTLSYSQQLTNQLQEKGFSITRDLGVRSVDAILIDDVVSLYRLVNDVVKVEPDVYYAFILNPQGKVMVHTFEGGFPKGLSTANPLNSNQGTQLLDTEEGFIRDIAVPIMDGSLGILHVGVSETRIRKAVAASIQRLIAIIGLVLVGGIAVVHLLINKIVKPVSEMTKAAELIGEGDLNTKVSIGSKDEVGKLAYTFNLMATKLKKAKEDLENVQEQLIQTRKLAAIGHFASGVVHEINNPLDGIINCIHTLRSKPLTKKQARKYLGLVAEGLFRIETITKKLLGLSRDRPLSLVPTNINELIEKALFFVDYRMAQKRISLRCKFTSNLPLIDVDAGSVLQVLVNLCLNAIESMLDDGVLSITTTTDTTWLKILIADTGTGISKDNLNKIFLPFFTTKEEGIGLGLSICLNIVEQHMGEIEVKSILNKGTVFIVKLPSNLK